MGCCANTSKVKFEVDIGKRNEFITDFLNTNFNEEEDQRTGIFIKNHRKKMIISKNSVKIEQELIVTTKFDNQNTYSDSFWILLDKNPSELKSKEIYVDDEKVDDSKFETNGSNIKIEYKGIFNGETRKIKIFQEFEKNFNDYENQSLILNKIGTPVRFLIYPEDNIKIDDITNENYVFNRDLNLAYFEGKTTKETTSSHGYVHYSKTINFQIYKFIPEYKKFEDEILTIKQNTSKEDEVSFLAIYKKIIITDYGQDIEEIYKFKLSNFEPGVFLPTISHGLLKETKYEIYFVELNGKKADYTDAESLITINNFGARNNQFGEIHIKYKYFTNEEKNILRQENIITGNTRNTYCKIILEIPNKYVFLSSNDIFQKDHKNNNIYFFNGIAEDEPLKELFKLSLKNGTWDIQEEFVLESKKDIDQCTFMMSRLFKGGNLKEKEFEIIQENGEFVDDEKENKFIFNFKDLRENTTTIKLRVKAENSTSGYNVINKKDLITKIPDEDKQFFKDLSNKILKEDKSDFPVYKKLGKWVHNYITYNLKYTGTTYTAKEIYNNKEGVCKHFTLLYNTLLVSQGIDAIYISGYALDLTENNVMKENETTKALNTNPNTLDSQKHAWTLAKIDGKWVPLDSTWNMFDKNLPISHIFQGYDNITFTTRTFGGNQVDNKITKENIKYIKN